MQGLCDKRAHPLGELNGSAGDSDIPSIGDNDRDPLIFASHILGERDYDQVHENIYLKIPPYSRTSYKSIGIRVRA